MFYNNIKFNKIFLFYIYRFSDSLFQSCDVMIKDLFESAYVNIHVFSRQSICNSITEYQYSVKALIMSEYYWPKFKNNANVKLPKVIKAHFDFYKKCFEMYKVEYDIKICC